MTVLSDALNNGKYIPQLDISSAYQYIDLEDELYIRAPLNKTLKQKSNKIKKNPYMDWNDQEQIGTSKFLIIFF